MKGFGSISRTLNNSSRKTSLRPNSATKAHSIKVNSSLERAPPIIFTMPNNKKKLSGMGNKIEREQLYEDNMQLKDIINKLNRELAETRNQVVKKDLEIRKKERIIKECSKENDIESVHELNLEKARESTLISLCKDKYNELKKLYVKKCEENEILKANIKITKLKEYQIQIDILKKEMEKIRNLYLSTMEVNKKLNQQINEYQTLKTKFLSQHKLINGLLQKSNQCNDNINELKEENYSLKLKLEENLKQKRSLENSNLKLKRTKLKLMNQKKANESYDLNKNDNEKKISKLRKELNEYKRLYGLRNEEFKKLKDYNDNLVSAEMKRKRELQSLKPFNYNQIKEIESIKETKDSNKLSLYKSLLDESKYKIDIYELYLKKLGVDKDKLIKAFGYNGIMTSNTKISDNNIINNNLVSTESNATNNNMNNENNDNDNNINNENNNINLISTENNEELNKEETININSINNLSEVNSANTNAITVSTNKNKLTKIEEENQEEVQHSEENQLFSLLHVFVKNFESNDITKEEINHKIEDICKLFENKEETTKEEFIEPFIKMFIESMKITKENDIEVITSFLSYFVDSLNGETVNFFKGLMEIFDNIKDYKNVNKDLEVSFQLNKYKEKLLDILKKTYSNENHLITFDIFRKIVQDLKIVLDDESMEYLIYKMKKNVPENSSIFDLNYEIIEKLLEKNEIGDIFINIKNILINNKTNIDNECQEFLNAIEIEDMKFLLIKKEDFFSVLNKLNIQISENIKNGIYESFKVEFENDRNEPQYFMEYDKIKNELQ